MTLDVPHRLALVLALLLLGPPAARAEEAGEDSDALPLHAVTLFTSGVGYFEHRATVDGTQDITLTFEADDVNDLLKSMVVQDLGGGTVPSVTYGSRDPVSKALQSFAVDLTRNVTLAELFESLRGERVDVETREGTVRGSVLSVQVRAEQVGDRTLQRDFLNLMTADGIRSLAFDELRSIRLLDARLEREVQQALQTLALGRDNRKRSVTLSFAGEGARPVRVGYVQETPVWKTSYRLVLGPADDAYLQGWAVIENTTNRDWQGVVLTLVSGAPVSFVMNLYEPLYATRPEVEPELRPGVAPQRYDRELAELERQASKARKAGAPARRARARDQRGAPPAPAEGGAWAAEDLDLGQGVESAAQGAEVGELFQYRIDTPVHLARQRSAMIPIVGEDVRGRKLSVFDARVHAKHPLNGVRLENTTALHLMQGPVTVFDGGTYAGDALLGDLPSGADRILTYALDLEVEVAVEGESRPEDLVEVRIFRGVLQSRYVQERRTSYTVRNDDGKARTVLLVHPIQGDWRLVRPTEGVDRTRSDLRLTVEVEAGARLTTELVEQRRFRQTVALTNLDGRLAAVLLQGGVASEALKEAIREVQRRQAEIAATAQQIRDGEQELQAIAQEQNRIRQNMGQIDRTSELYRRYMQKLGAQEDRVDALRGELETLRARRAELQANLDAFLRDLQVD